VAVNRCLASDIQPSHHDLSRFGRFCGEAVLKGANIFAAGIIGMSENLSLGDRVSVFVDVDGSLSKGCNSIASFKTDGILFVANGILTMGRAEMFPSGAGHVKGEWTCPRGVAVEVAELEHYLPPMNSLFPGLMYAQSMPSTVTGHVLGPKPGERVLDMCAAPGGKTTHLAQLMENRGVVIAFDRGEKKVAKIRGSAQELGLGIVSAFANDALKYHSYIAECPPKESSKYKHPPGKAIYERESFDRVLCEPPCSALGVRPRLKQEATLKELQTHANHQRNFLRAAVMLLKVGGVLVFSTCTVNPLENEGNVAWCLEEFPLELIQAEPRVGGEGLPESGLSEEQCALVQRFTPGSGRYDAPGFFIAKFKKTASYR